MGWMGSSSMQATHHSTGIYFLKKRYPPIPILSYTPGLVCNSPSMSTGLVGRWPVKPLYNIYVKRIILGKIYEHSLLAKNLGFRVSLNRTGHLYYKKMGLRFLLAGRNTSKRRKEPPVLLALLVIKA